MTAVLQGVRILEVAEHTFVPAASALLVRLGRRGHQDRARRARRRHARAWRRPASPSMPERRPRPARALEPGQAEPRPSTSPRRRRPRHPLPARRHRPTCSSPTSCPSVRDEAARSTSTRSGPTTRTSSTCGAPARASAGPTPTRAPTTRSRSGPGPASRSAPSAPSTTSCPSRPAPGFGDSIGAMTIAGGIMGALFHRERTGEATIVDVSLLGTGLWAMGQAMALSLAARHAVGGRRRPTGSARNPLSRNYDTKDGRFARVHLPAGRQVLAAAVRGRSAAPSSPPTRASPTTRRSWPTAPRPSRCSTRCSPRATARRVARAARPTSPASGPSCRTRSRRRSTRRPSPTATCRTARPPTARRSSWSAAPVQFDEEPAAPGRAPEFNEHGDEILDRARARLGHHRRPQGPRRRRLTRRTRHHRTTRRPDMTLFDAFRYDGKRALVVGGATGMGAAAAELVQDAGAEVVVMDFAEVTLAGRQGHPRQPRRARRRSTPPSTSAAARSTRCSPAPASPTARPASRRSTSSATAT